MAASAQSPPPDSILIVGAGVFGLSTALSLLLSPRYTSTHITLLDSHAPIPRVTSSHSTPSEEDHADSYNPHGASIDSSRIIRADYSNPVYTSLATQAQEHWRKDDALSKHYHECGLAIVGERGQSGWEYIEKSRWNVSKEASRISGTASKTTVKENPHSNNEDLQILDNEEAIKELLHTDGSTGEAGYVNWHSGWADAGAAMSETRRRVSSIARQQDRQVWKRGQASRLLFAQPRSSPSAQVKPNQRITGVQLSDGSSLQADLTILATGAWTGSLLDLRGRLEATGQVLAYVPLSTLEAQKLQNMPVILNLASGMFAIPPCASSPSQQLKIARHAYGYRNPVTVSTSESEQGTSRSVSIPSQHFSPIPAEAEHACRAFLSSIVPSLAHRPFESTRLCWYADTPEGDYLVDYHPEIEGLFLASGGSGHAFKFLPVLGDRVVEALEGRLEEGLSECWKWPQETKGFQGTEDGSRSGFRGPVLAEALERDLRVDERKGISSKL